MCMGKDLIKKIQYILLDFTMVVFVTLANTVDIGTSTTASIT